LLSQCLKTAVEEGLIQVNPAQGVRVPSDDVKGASTTFLTRDELGLLIDAVYPLLAAPGVLPRRHRHPLR